MSGQYYLTDMGVSFEVKNLARNSKLGPESITIPRYGVWKDRGDGKLECIDTFNTEAEAVEVYGNMPYYKLCQRPEEGRIAMARPHQVGQ